MGLLTVLAIVIIAMILVGAVLGKLTWERAIVLMIVVAIVAVAFALIGPRL